MTIEQPEATIKSPEKGRARNLSTFGCDIQHRPYQGPIRCKSGWLRMVKNNGERGVFLVPPSRLEQFRAKYPNSHQIGIEP
ncbi:hypothetical protein [Nibrella saemangeumensis]